MNTYTHQSKKAKPQPASQCIDRLKRELESLGYTVEVQHGTGLYAPSITLCAWAKRETKEAKA